MKKIIKKDSWVTAFFAHNILAYPSIKSKLIIMVMVVGFWMGGSCRHNQWKFNKHQDPDFGYSGNKKAVPFEINGSFQSFKNQRFIGIGQIEPRSLVPLSDGQLVIDRTDSRFDIFINDYTKFNERKWPPRTSTKINTHTPDEDSLSTPVDNPSSSQASDKHSNVDSQLAHYAFDLITPTGKDIFLASRKYIEIQQLPGYFHKAQPLQCVANVSYVLHKAGINYIDRYSVNIANLIDQFSNNQAKIHSLPRDPDNLDNHVKQVTDYLQTNFGTKIKIPTGSVVIGCEQSCWIGGSPGGAHASIVGDTNEFGQLMVYHNNWFRPNNVKGDRLWYMVPVRNFYYLHRPRKWMATPWINIDNEDKTKIMSAFAHIDDLDPFNNTYQVLIIVPKEIEDQYQRAQIVNHHRFLNVEENVHAKLFQDYMANEDNNNYICKSSVGIKDLDPRTSPQGAVHEVYHSLESIYRSNQRLKFAFNNSFEFLRLQTVTVENEQWYGIKLYEASRFFGKSPDSRVWIKPYSIDGRKLVECRTERLIYR